MDLDHFKRINDQFGHAAGDEALRQVAEVLQKNKRDYDCTGRWGGEEFLVVLPGTSLSQAAMVAERIRTSIQAVRLDLGGSEAVELTRQPGCGLRLPGLATRGARRPPAPGGLRPVPRQAGGAQSSQAPRPAASRPAPGQDSP